MYFFLPRVHKVVGEFYFILFEDLHGYVIEPHDERMLYPVDKKLGKENDTKAWYQLEQLVHVPVELGHVSNEYYQKEYKIVESLFHVIAAHEKHVVLVKLFEHATFYFDKLFCFLF